MELLGADDRRFQLAAMEDAEFEAGGFDFVTFGAVLEHLYDPDAALAKAMRWLRPGGVAHAEIPNSRHLVGRLINAYYRLLGTGFVTNISPMHVPFHLYEFSIASFHRNGARNRYSVADHWIDVGSIDNIPSVLHPLLRAIMSRSDTGMQLSVFLRKNAER
jgi:SAM-dependent methyltransferase